jgi:hypothetical protein
VPIPANSQRRRRWPDSQRGVRGGDRGHEPINDATDRGVDIGADEPVIGSRDLAHEHARRELRSGTECVTRTLHDKQRDAHLEFGCPASLRVSGRVQRKRQRKHAAGPDHIGRAAGDPSAAAAATHDEGQRGLVGTQQGDESLDDSRPCRIELTGRGGSPPTGDRIRLAYAGNGKASRTSGRRDRDQIRRGNAAARAVAEHEQTPRRCRRSFENCLRSADRRLDRDQRAAASAFA